LSTRRLTAWCSNPARSARAAGGFTLTELVLILVLLGGLAAVSAPRFFSSSGFDERVFYEEVRSAVRYAGKLAVATGCDVQFSISGDSFSLAQQASCSSGGWTQAVTHPATGAAGYSSQAPSGVSLGSGVNPIVFDALGRAKTAGGVTTDVSLAVGPRAVEIYGETGFVDAS
jgi:MSHA pilin protein MshC